MWLTIYILSIIVFVICINIVLKIYGKSFLSLKTAYKIDIFLILLVALLPIVNFFIGIISLTMTLKFKN